MSDRHHENTHWESKDIKYELVGLKLRPQLPEVTALDEIKISIKVGELEERANEFKSYF